MPTYQYKCEECGIVFDRFQHFSEEPLDACPECSGQVRRVVQPVGIIFKGKGFYVTDHRGASSSTMPKPDPKEEGAQPETGGALKTEADKGKSPDGGTSEKGESSDI